MWSKVDDPSDVSGSQEGWGSVSLKLSPVPDSVHLSSGAERPVKTAVTVAGAAIFPVPDDSEEQQIQATAAAVAGDNPTAVAKFQQALFYRPDYAKGHEMWAQLLREMGRAFDSVQAATTATTLNPEWPDAWVTLARCQANLGEPEMAVKSVDKARHLTGDQGLLADEVSEWRDLVAAREGAQQEESLSYRVNVVEPN